LMGKAQWVSNSLRHTQDWVGQAVSPAVFGLVSLPAGETAHMR